MMFRERQGVRGARRGAGSPAGRAGVGHTGGADAVTGTSAVTAVRRGALSASVLSL